MRSASFHGTEPGGAASHHRRPFRGGVLVALFVFAAGTGHATQPHEFTFQGLNRTYRDLPMRPEPMVWGPFRLQLASPRSELTVSGHRLQLSPVGDGTHRCEVDLEFSGNGTLVADVTVLGFATRQEDEVALPRQSQSHLGLVRLTRGTDGYQVTALETPRQVRVAIRSRLAGRLVSWCEGLPGLGTLGNGCQRLDRSLSSVTVPLPPPGETYVVPYTELAPAERELLDRYLDETEGG